MSEAIIAALLSGGTAIVVCLINNICQQNKVQRQHEETVTLIEYRIDELAKKVDKHNGVIERMYVLEEKQKVANHRIDDLEKKGSSKNEN